MMTEAVTRADIDLARERIAGMAVRTPLLRSSALDAATGGTILVKPENLQRTGSFKFRGAYNRLSMIPEADRKNGVVACSSGNHAQGVAEAARLLGMPATIVMPDNAPQVKLRRTKAFGAKVVTYDRETEDREAIARAICAETGATFVHPYNDPGVLAGQGTIGAEIAEQVQEYGISPDQMLICTGGGGLAGGIALALETDLPDCRVSTVEPEGFDDYSRSLESGIPVTNDRKTGSVCDAILTESPGTLSFPILSRVGANGLVISDAEALAAVAFAFRELKLVVEPGGAAALAAALSGKVDLAGKTTVLVLSGGNIDEAMLQRALSEN